MSQGAACQGRRTTDRPYPTHSVERSHGKAKWSEIAESIPGRNGKQCRERWRNQLDDSINTEPWSEQEDRVLLEAHHRMGNKWSEICKLLDGGSCVCVCVCRAVIRCLPTHPPPPPPRFHPATHTHNPPAVQGAPTTRSRIGGTLLY